MEKIPIVDFSGMLGDSLSEREAVAREVDRCAREVGFMYLRNFGIARESIEKMRETAQRFFHLSMEEKKRFAFDQSLNFGYHAMGTEALDPSKPKDQKETFTMRNLLAYQERGDLFPHDYYREVVSDFFTDCQRLADRLTSAFAMALDLPKDFFREKHTGLTQTLRLLHYPPAEVLAAGQLGAGAHTDYGTTTFVFQDDSGGLEVQNDSGEWIPATPIPDTLVVNTGDLLARWTNDVYRSTPHRVQVRPAAAKAGRLSIAFFNDPDPEVMVETIPSCVTHDRPAKYPPISAYDHILERIAATN